MPSKEQQAIVFTSANSERHIFARLEFQIMMGPVALHGLMDDLLEAEKSFCSRALNQQKKKFFREKTMWSVGGVFERHV